MRSLCVFCGARPGRRNDYVHVARELAKLLVGRGIRIVYGAGSVGLMGQVADAALAQGGEVVGVIPRHLCSAEVLHDNLTELHVTDSLLERKWLMMELADGFIALPGGLGTLDEILEVCTWRQLGRHAKPVGLVNTGGFFDPFLTALERAVEEDFLDVGFQRTICVQPDPASLLSVMMDRAGS